MAFALREGLHFCISGEQVILLDLRAGRYFALPANHNDVLRLFLTKQPIASQEVDILNRLVRQGILCSTEQQCTSAAPSIPRAPVPINGMDTTHTRRSSLRIAVAVVSRILWARRIKHWGLERQIRSLCQLDSRGSSRRTGDARAIVRAFEVSDLLLGSHDKCLERSFALTAICRKNGLPARAIIGVQHAPFAAHCWVQIGETILNEKPDRAKLFTPILVI